MYTQVNARPTHFIFGKVVVETAAIRPGDTPTLSAHCLPTRGRQALIILPTKSRSIPASGASGHTAFCLVVVGPFRDGRPRGSSCLPFENRTCTTYSFLLELGEECSFRVFMGRVRRVQLCLERFDSLGHLLGFAVFENSTVDLTTASCN